MCYQAASSYPSQTTSFNTTSDDQKCLVDVTLREFYQSSHRPLLRFHVTTIFSEKANADCYTDSLTGRLWFTSVSTLKNPKVFALPSNFTDHSLTPAVHLPNAAKATAPGPLCFDQVEANHWSVEQEAAGMAWYGPQWQATRLWALLQRWQSCSSFWPSGCNSFHFRKAHVCIWHSLIIALLRHGYYGNEPWPYSELCQEERERDTEEGWTWTSERKKKKKKTVQGVLQAEMEGAVVSSIES